MGFIGRANPTRWPGILMHGYPAAVTPLFAWRNLGPIEAPCGVFAIMPRLVLLLVFVLASCDVFDMSQPAEFGSGDMQGWRLLSGQTPRRAEYAALVAACQDGAVRPPAAAGAAGPLD